MGHSHSSASAVAKNINNNVLNVTDISNINKTVIESAVNVLIKNASSCSSSVNQINNCSINDAKIAMNFNLGGAQTNKASVNFSCIQASSASSEMASAMKQAMLEQLKNLSGSEAAARVNAAASEVASGSGFYPVDGGPDDNGANVNNNITNRTNEVVEHIYEQNLKDNFNSETVDECIGKTTQKNNISAEGIVVGESANVNCTQSNSLEQVQECKQLNEATHNTLTKTAQELGFKVLTESETQSETSINQESSKKKSGFFYNIENMLDLTSLGSSGPFVIICCCICCCVLLSCICFTMFKGSKENENYGNYSSSTHGAHRSRTSHNVHSHRKFRGGYSDTSANTDSDIIEYLGLIGLNVVSDIVSTETPLFE
jgi:hypothetical protein